MAYMYFEIDNINNDKNVYSYLVYLKNFSSLDFFSQESNL